MNKNLIRSCIDATASHLRAVDDEKRIIEGYAIVFNKRSHLLYDWTIGKRVEEVIHPEAVSMDMLRKQDISACLEHNGGQLLARYRNGKGSLEISIDEVGVKVRFSAPDTPWGQQAYEGVKRGDYYGMSFGYYNKLDESGDEVGVTYEKEGEGENAVTVRHVHSIYCIFDVSIVAHPAYEDTSVEARSMDENIRKAIDKHFGKVEEKKDEKENTRSKEMMRDYDEISKVINNHF